MPLCEDEDRRLGLKSLAVFSYMLVNNTQNGSKKKVKQKDAHTLHALFK